MLTRENHGRHGITRKSCTLFRVIPCLPWFKSFRATALTCIVLFCGSSVSAHPISLTDSVVDVQKDHVDVELKVLVEDLVLYYPVSANEHDVYPAAALIKAARSHREFVLDGLTLLDERGTSLEGSIVNVDASRLPDKGVPLTGIKQVSVSYRLSFPTRAPLHFLTVSQTFGGEQAILPAMMDCQVKQLDIVLDVPQPLLSGQTLTTKFDWSKLPTPPKNWRELKKRRTERLKEQLGIASYSGLYSFFYITPHEVRHEILIPLLTLDEWTPIKRKNPEFIEVVEQEVAAEQVAKFFRKGNPVSINGSSIKPVVARVNFFGLDIRDFAMNAEPRRVSVAQARVGVMLSYPSKDVPTNVSAKWETFNKFAPFLKSVVYEFNKPATEYFFRPDDDAFSWSRSHVDKKRTAETATVKSNGRSPTSSQAEQISYSLIRNVYRAFDFHGEKETYDALNAVVDGPLLRSLYLQIRRSLLMAEQGGSRSRVLDVKRVSSTLVGTPSRNEFRIELRWRLSSEVEHWGHIHTRENEYVGRLAISDADGFWKLDAVRFLSQKRVRFETRLRGMNAE
jgi:hypothetical protein